MDGGGGRAAAGEHAGVRIYNEPGALLWNDAATEDPDAARGFHGSVFHLSGDEVPEMGGYTTFSRGGDPLGGLSAHQPGMRKGWSTCFAVTSADDAVARVEAGGGTVLMPAQDSPYGRFAVLEAPRGRASR